MTEKNSVFKAQKKIVPPSLVAVVFISLVTAKIFTKFHTPKFKALIEAAQGVLSRKPHWLAYQNRLLAPYSVYRISLFGFSFEDALMIFYVATIIFQTILVYVLVLKWTKNNFSLSVLYAIYFSFMFIGIQHSWFYTWDSLEVIIFIFFSWGIWQRQPTLYFVGLFFVALVNKESAIFIAVFLALDSLYFKKRENFLWPKIRFRSGAKLIAGSLLTLFGIIYTKFVREYLFISSSALDIGDDSSNKLLGNHFTLPDNLHAFFIDNISSADIINTIFVIGIVVFLVMSMNRFEDRDYKAAIIIVLIILTIFIFGLVNETRIYAPLIPFILFFYLRLNLQLENKQTNSQ